MEVEEIVLAETEPLGGGSSLVIIVDPEQRTMQLCDLLGRAPLMTAQTLSHTALPDINLPLADFFERALRHEF
jgi:hypothetical protein